MSALGRRRRSFVDWLARFTRYSNDQSSGSNLIARRAQRTNNLKQLGLAVHNYLSQQNAFSPLFESFNYVGSAAPNINSVRGPWPMTWAMALLPFYEQGALYNTVNFSNGVFDAANDYTLSLDQSPDPQLSDGEHHRRSVGEHEHGELSGQFPGPADRLDLERADRCHAVHADQHEWTGDQRLLEHGHVRRRESPGRDLERGGDQRETPTTTGTPRTSGRAWRGIRLAAFRTRRARSRTRSRRRAITPGGVNVAFCDGSVRFIKDTIGVQTWWAVGSRNGPRWSAPTSIDFQ